MGQAADPPLNKDLLVGIAVLVFQKVKQISDMCVGDPRDRKSIACTLYHGALFVDASAFILLIENGLTSSAEKLLRSILEYSVNMLNIDKNEWYLDYLVFESLYSERSQMNKLKELGKSKKYKGKINFSEDKDKLIERMISEYSDRWDQPKNIAEKFDILKMQAMYSVYYSLLSGNVHGQLLNLTNQFENKSGSKEKVNLSNEAPLETLRDWVEVFIVSLWKTTELLCTVLDMKPTPELAEMKRMVSHFQKTYYKSAQ